MSPITLVSTILVASFSVALAQDRPVLRAAPPAVSGVIKRAPDQMLGVDAATIETLGGWVASGTDWVGKAVDRGAALVDVTRNDFVGSGGFRNLSKNRVNAYYDTVHGLSDKTRNSLPYRFAPQLYRASDYIGAVVDPLLAGDGRGAVSGAVNLGATSVTSSAGAGGGAWLGTLIGDAIGSFVPVVGNVVGATVGGGVGTVAGGYVVSAGYESYLKQGAVHAAEAGIAALIDPDTLQQAMQAKQLFLHQNVSPEVAIEWDRMYAASQNLGAGEVQMHDWGRVPYVVAPKTPEVTQQQAPEQQARTAAIEAALRSASGLELSAWNPQHPDYIVHGTCKISSSTLQCEAVKDDAYMRMTSSFVGRISGTEARGMQSIASTARYRDGCSNSFAAQNSLIYRFLEGGELRVEVSAGQQRLVANTCPGSPAALVATPAQSLVGTWQVE